MEGHPMRTRIQRFLAWRWAPWSLAGVVAVLAVALSLVWTQIQGDVMMRYAPMAEAFAAGDWFHAFHPRFGVGFPILVGAWVWLTGLDGHTACVQVSLVAWACGGPLLFGLVQRLFDRTTAWVAFLLYMVCPMLFLWAICGLREPFRTLGLLLAAQAVLERRDGASGLAKMLVATLTFCTFRADTIAMAVAAWVLYAAYDRGRARTWILAGWGALCLQPTSLLAYVWTGVWLPSVQIVQVWERVWEALL